MYKHKKFVLTGGPCAGKTTALQRLVSEFTEKDYKVFVVPETATELINGGVRPFGSNNVDMVDFQRYVLELQMAKENLYDKVANNTLGNTVIFCDRGIMDNKAYIPGDVFKTLIDEKKISEMEIMAKYDAIIHLVTAANGKEEYYTTSNNTARTETVEEAKILDKKTLDSWLGHKKIHIIDNSTNFDEKIDRVVECVSDDIGLPYQYQNQYKYLVSDINVDLLKDISLVKLEIEQFFTDFLDGCDIMVRKTTKDGCSTCCKTTKRDTNIPGKRITTSSYLTLREYEELKNNHPGEFIRKSRYCFTFDKSYFRLDIFDNPKGLVILETETSKENDDIRIPEFIKVSREITDDIDYRNSHIYQELNEKNNKQLIKRNDKLC